MDEGQLNIFKGHKLKIFLKQNIVYTGTIQNIYSDNFIILDKYNNSILIKFDILERIEVQE